MEAKLTVKNGKAQITLGNGKAINIPAISREGIKAKFQKFAVKNGKAIVSVYAQPKANISVNLKEIGTSNNAHKFAGIESAKLIVGKAYIAKQGKAIKVS
jgi:hypothetical protein